MAVDLDADAGGSGARTLSSYGISAGSTIWLTSVLPGGAPKKAPAVADAVPRLKQKCLRQRKLCAWRSASGRRCRKIAGGTAGAGKFCTAHAPRKAGSKQARSSAAARLTAAGAAGSGKKRPQPRRACDWICESGAACPERGRVKKDGRMFCKAHVPKPAGSKQLRASPSTSLTTAKAAGSRNNRIHS